MNFIGRATARWLLKGILLSTLVLTGCSVGRTGTTGLEAGPGAAPFAPARPLVIYIGREPASVATRALVQQNSGLSLPLRLFNALPAVIDERGLPQPELLESLPALNTASWQVFPDGTMQTTYTLRPRLTWHDGQPLTADDFVFAWRVYSSPELGRVSQQPMVSITDAAVIDGEHFMIRWKVPYPDADNLSQLNRELQALPHHILGPAFDQIAMTGADAFGNQPFWTYQYMGLGPYRIQRWEAGSFIDAIRFDGYALGAPKIARIQVRFSADQNVVVASLLAGEAHLTGDSALASVPDALIQQWERTKAGTFLQRSTTWRATAFQLRPDVANPRVILDVRVRKAVAHAVDKQAIGDSVYGGQSFFSDTPIWSRSTWGPALDDSITTYPLDPRAAESLLNQAGLSKGSDGFYRGAEGRLSLELATTESATGVSETLVLADQLRVAGLDVQPRVIPAAQAQDAQIRSAFPAMQSLQTFMGESGLNSLATIQIPTPGNRWLGSNRGGWASSDYDRLLEAFNTTLDRGDRLMLVRQMMRVYTDDLPLISLFFPTQAYPHVAELKGPAPAAPESNPAWNIYEWEFN